MLKKLITHHRPFWENRLHYVLGLVAIYWIQCLFAYAIDFKGLEINVSAGNLSSWFQILIAFLNPVPTALLLIGASLFIKRTRPFYWTATITYIILAAWLFSNTIYFREFSDFISLATIIASPSTAKGLGAAAFGMLRWSDLFYLVTCLPLVYMTIRCKTLTFDHTYPPLKGACVTALAVLFASFNMMIAEIQRPELLSRGFSNPTIVRSLGLPSFFIYNSLQTYTTSQERSKATAEDLEPVETYVKDHYAKPNPEYFGMAKGRNVIVIHLESFQQFLIDFQLSANGTNYEVTPFINSLYHSTETFAFSNFFHQVKAGKTSDAETLMENSLFGQAEGSFMNDRGGTNTQQAAPHILSQFGYTSAVFHGNIGSFWKRNVTYKQWGYDYFFDQNYMTVPNSDNSFEYGLNDKVMLQDSIPYLERLQQPFYAKFLTVTNHYPYEKNIKGADLGFPLANTTDNTVNGYFATANYLDSAVEEFFNYLKASGLYEHSIIVLYGDHYGISEDRLPALAPLLGKNSKDWTKYDTAMMQRVPYMVVVPGTDKGHISETYGGQIDALPTLEHLLGIDTQQYIQLGQDLLSQDRQQLVAFRQRDCFVSPTYTKYGEQVYHTSTGAVVSHPDKETKQAITRLEDASERQLKMSDAIQIGDLLRFSKNGLPPVNIADYNYQNAHEKLINSTEENDTSLYHQKGDKSTVNLFQTTGYVDRKR